MRKCWEYLIKYLEGLANGRLKVKQSLQRHWLSHSLFYFTNFDHIYSTIHPLSLYLFIRSLLLFTVIQNIYSNGVNIYPKFYFTAHTISFNLFSFTVALSSSYLFWDPSSLLIFTDSTISVLILFFLLTQLHTTFTRFVSSTNFTAKRLNVLSSK